MANQQTNQTASQQLRDQLDSYKSRVSKSRKRKRIAYIAGLCLVVVAIAALIVPAATLEYGKTYCEQEEHTHTDVCVNRTVVCGLPDTSNGNGHVHVPSCYDNHSVLAICGKTPVAHMHLPTCVNAAGTELICGQEETVHMHTLACVDPATNTFICGAEDLPHVHGVTCYSLGSDGSYVLVCNEPSVGHVHTMLCLDPETGEVVCGQEEVIELEHVHTDACYEEELICGMEEHVHNELCYDEITEAIMKKDEESSAAKEAAEEVEGIEPGVAEGDLTADEIAEAKDQGLLFENEDIVVVFDVPERYADDIVLTVTETDDEVEFVEAIDATEEVDAEGEPVDDEAAQDGDNGETVFFSEDGDETANDGADESTDEADEPTDAVDAATAAFVAESEDEPAYQINLRIEATLNGEPVDDIAALGLSAKLQVKPKIIAPILAEIDYAEVAEEIRDEVGAEIQVLQQPDNTDAASISEIRAEQIDEVVATSVQEAATTFDVVSDALTALVNEPKDIPFSVRYEARVPIPMLGTPDGQLTLIDTTGANLPTNGATPKTISMEVDDTVGSPTYGSIVTNTELLEIFTKEDYYYFKHPSINHIDKVANKEFATKEPNYKLDQIKVVYADGSESDTVNYVEGSTFLTNNPEAVSTDEKTYVIIAEDCQVVLIYETTGGSSPEAASFYDYDISNGWVFRTNTPWNYTDYNHKYSGDVFEGDTISDKFLTWARGNSAWDGNIYTYTYQSGINSSGNYSGSGTKLAFGNVNSGTGLGKLKWGGNELNKYNNSGYEGCTFGLVSGLDPNGNIVYSGGVDAPKLFNESGNVTGKTTYKSSLSFDRVGDTYTLSSARVGNKTLTGLNTLDHPSDRYQSIWTNDFWPMDLAESFGTGTHDIKFGATETFKGAEHEIRYGPITERGTDYTFPESDDGKYHNSYFGMNYSLDFKLTSDYCGPLNYIFFGDDDLWVFLDGQLIVDIGGVHSSVGEYVDLWDYVSHGDSGTHTLSVFYTERGASGSTCYMNFTLPWVSFKEEAQKTGSFTVLKNVSAANKSDALEEKEFTFSLELIDENNQINQNKYPITRYNKNGMVISGESDRVGTGDTFTLKDGDFALISYLPLNTKYKVQEVFNKEEGTPPFNISWSYSEDGVEKDSQAGEGMGNVPDGFEGTVSDPNVSYLLTYINKVLPELPATGGEGTYWYWIGGGALVLLALAMFWRRQTLATASASPFTKSEATVLAFFGDTNHASPSGKPESVYSKGQGRAGKGDESAWKGGRY